jgi:hypothetical protein
MDIRASSYFVSGKGLLIYRCLAFLWVLIYFPINIAYHFQGLSWFKFLTHWSWVGLLLYFSAAVIISLNENRIMKYSFTKLFVIYDILFATVITIPWMVTIIFWSILNSIYTARQDAIGRFDALNPHTFNLILILIEIILCKSIPGKYDISYPLIAL